MFARIQRNFSAKFPNFRFYMNGRIFRDKNSTTFAKSVAIATGAGTLAAGSLLAVFYWSDLKDVLRRVGDDWLKKYEIQAAWGKTSTTQASHTITPQPNVFSQGKDHALYLWIHLEPQADRKEVAKAMTSLQKLVDTVSPPDLRDETDEIWAGVGFGNEFFTQVFGKKPPVDYSYPYRKGCLGDLPNTQGDVFVHAKCNSAGKLFELAQHIKRTLPKLSVKHFNDTYSFIYRNGRDLSGFVDGTENPADDESRFKVAVEKSSGGSYCVTQKWVHLMEYVETEKDEKLEGFIGRTRADSIELKQKPATSHLARMTSGPGLDAKKPFEIVRQSMPYGTLGGEAGLFFIAFAESPKNFDYMLDRMTGRTADHLNDDVMRFTRCVSGNYWYFPSVEELKKLA